MNSKAAESPEVAIPPHYDGPTQRSTYRENLDLNKKVSRRTSCDGILLTDPSPI